MNFSDIKYERAEIEEIGKKYTSLTKKLTSAGSFEDVCKTIEEHEKLLSHFQTMSSVAYVRHTIDTDDNFYSAEKEYYDENEPLLEEKIQQFTKALTSNKYRNELELRYGKLLFVNAEMEQKAFSPEIIPLLQEENRLCDRYQRLIASARIEFDGKTLNISQLGAYKENPDRDIRRGAYTAEGNFYLSYAEELDSVFDKLVKCRTEIANKLGFDSFTKVAYLRHTRNCYGAEEVKAFRDEVKRQLVPAVRKLKKLQSARIGIPDMKFYDDLFEYPDGNPKPMGTQDDILKAGVKMYSEMSPLTKDFIEYMTKNSLMDLEAKPGKAVGGYCTEFPEFGAPFIFSNFNGTSGDVDVLTHEAGHAFASYIAARNIDVLELRSPTMDACECHSMSMEFLAWRWMESFYGKDAQRARSMHLTGALTFIPYGCMVDEFQHIIYDNPKLSPDERNNIWLGLEKQYRPYIDFDSLPFYSEGRGWQRQLHIYLHPFYYIDYCLAQTVSLYFRKLSEEDFSAAWKKYYEFVSHGGTKTLTELCLSAGIPDPFSAGALGEIVFSAVKWLSQH